MREIKFRAWVKHVGKMYQVRELFHMGSEGFNTITCVDDKDKVFWDLKEYELMQYIGLNDKNGKEIYEGDVLSNGDGSIVKCIWNETKTSTGFAFQFIKHGNQPFFDSREREVIGNIYENPELLEI